MDAATFTTIATGGLETALLLLLGVLSYKLYKCSLKSSCSKEGIKWTFNTGAESDEQKIDPQQELNHAYAADLGQPGAA